ncbi:MAG: hypothetical protein ACN4E2_01095 [Nitrospinota bacterium]
MVITSIRTKHGGMLVIALTLLLITLLIAVNSLTLTTEGAVLTSVELESEQARWAAYSGLSWVKALHS